MKEILKKSLLVLFFIPLGLFAQSTVSGVISDEALGGPIPGVNVIVKGTTNGVSTDFDGNYTLSDVNDGDVIVFSYLGYQTQEIPFTGQSTLDIALLEDAAVLGEVLLIGYGSTDKQDATGAVQRVKAEEFNQGAIVSPSQLIAGKSAGVNITAGGAPGDGGQIRIRGGSSLTGNNDPLIVVDGIPLDQGGVQGVRNQLNSINPSEIESFDILKDASATAIYGSRASNGVILITTKQGKKNSPLKIDYGFQFSRDERVNGVDVLTADKFRELIATDPNADLSLLGNATTDWQDQIYQVATGAIHNVTASQGFNNWSYRVNYNNTSKQGILQKDLYRRNALNLNVTGNAFDNHLKMTLTTKGSLDDNFFANNGAIGGAVSFDPTQPVFDPTSPHDGYFEFIGEALAPLNPVAQLFQDNNKARSKRNITNLNAEYKFHFLPELKFITNLGFDYADLNGKQYLDRASILNDRGGSTPRRNFYSGINRNQNLDLLLNYKNEFRTVEYEVTAGHTYQEFYQSSFTDQTSVSGEDQDMTNINRNALESYFARASFDISDKYLISASFRRDGSSRFAKENRWGNFPAVSAGWKISNEDFLKDSKTISNLKIRGGYGVTGNQEFDRDYGYLGLYTPSQSSASVQIGQDENGLPIFATTLRPEEFDENLKWEETTQFNAGIDFGILDNKLEFTLDGYYRETKDLLARIPVAAGANLSDLLTTNVGETRSRGLELGINAVIANSENFQWNVNANGTIQDLEITKLNLSGDPDFFIPQGGISGGVGNSIQLWRPGYDPTTFFVFRQVYDNAGKPIEGAYVDVNGDNQITEADRQPYKKASPDAFIGFTNSMSYKSWQFNFTLRGALGNYVYNNVNSSTGFGANFFDAPGNYYPNGSSDVLNSGFGEAQFFSDYYIRRADYLKIDNISLAYTFPFEKVGLTASATMTNVFVITKYDGLDPEIASGIDNNIYPRPRGFVLGLNFSF